MCLYHFLLYIHNIRDKSYTEKCLRAVTLIFADALQKEASLSRESTKEEIAMCLSYIRYYYTVHVYILCMCVLHIIRLHILLLYSYILFVSYSRMLAVEAVPGVCSASEVIAAAGVHHRLVYYSRVRARIGILSVFIYVCLYKL